jgi:hypothetical protein
MTDLWHPEKRAALCASCHVGNAAEGKVVTHAMYAAGHPPLPPFEAATFSDAMPKHWSYLADKSKAVQDILEYDKAKVGLERTQLAVISALVSFRESMKLLAAHALEKPDPKDADKGWPEFAQFDCYACHHDLKAKSWRQERGFAGKPGRPGMRAWPTALLPLAIAHAAKGNAETEAKLVKEMQARLKAVNDAFDAKPFGDPKPLAEAATQAAAWADELLKQIQRSPFDDKAANSALSLLRKESAARWLDFDTARQFAWTYRAIQRELKLKSDTDSAKAMKDLEGQLQLDFPEGQIEISKDFVKDTLKKLNDYDPGRFKKAFEALQR